MATLHGVEIPDHLHTDGSSSVWGFLPDGQKYGFRAADASTVRIGLGIIDSHLAARGLEGDGDRIIKRDSRLIPPAVRQTLGV